MKNKLGALFFYIVFVITPSLYVMMSSKDELIAHSPVFPNQLSVEGLFIFSLGNNNDILKMHLTQLMIDPLQGYRFYNMDIEGDFSGSETLKSIGESVESLVSLIGNNTRRDLHTATHADDQRSQSIQKNIPSHFYVQNITIRNEDIQAKAEKIIIKPGNILRLKTALFHDVEVNDITFQFFHNKTILSLTANKGRWKYPIEDLNLMDGQIHYTDGKYNSFIKCSVNVSNWNITLNNDDNSKSGLKSHFFQF